MDRDALCVIKNDRIAIAVSTSSATKTGLNDTGFAVRSESDKST